MSVSIQFGAQEFNGNGSTVTAYPVNFPVLADSDVYVAILPTGETVRTVLNTSQFTLHKTGEARSITTATAYPSTTKVILFRWLSFEQPFDFPEGGRFSSEEVERALDRIVMLLQQLLPGVDTQSGGGGGTIIIPGDAVTVRGCQVWEDATARALVVPGYLGQPGIQLSDDSVWIGQTLVAGSWTEFRPLVAAPTPPDDRVTLAFVANTMTTGGDNAAVQGCLSGLSPAPDFVLFGGDGTQSEATFVADWAAFEPWIAGQKAGLALGNADISGATTWALPIAKFSYLGWTNRNWKKTLGNGLVEVFALHSGRNNAGTTVEPDGVDVGSAQHVRFQAWLAASTAVYKVVVVHDPMISSQSGVTIQSYLLWPELQKVDAVLCGHLFWNEICTYGAAPVFNVGRALGQAPVNLETSFKIEGDIPFSEVLRVSETEKTLARLVFTPARAFIEFIDIDDPTRVVHRRDLKDLSFLPSQWGAEVLGPDATAVVGSYHVGASPVGMKVGEWFVGVATTGATALTGYIKVNGTGIATFAIQPGNFWATVTSTNGGRLPLGATVDVGINASDSYPAWRGLAVYARGRIIQ